MKLPNGDRAFLDPAKLVDYCLSPEHPRGRHKARVFAAALGIRATDADLLGATLLSAAADEEATLVSSDAYGDRYVVDFFMTGPAGSGTVRSAWIVRRGEDFPRLTSCYVL